MGDGVLVGAVVVHGPDLLSERAKDFGVVDFAFGDAGDPSSQAIDNLVGEAVRDLAGGVLGGFLAVLLGDDLGVLEVLGVEEKSVDEQLAACDTDRSEYNIGCAGGRVGVALQLDLGGSAGIAGRHQALGDNIEDTGCGQIGIEGGVEGLFEGGVLGVGGSDRFEVGDCEADGGNSIAGTREDIVLAGGGRGEQGERRGEGQERERHKVSEWDGVPANCAGRSIHTLYGRRSR